MARQKAKELTERELELMHVFWEHGEMAIADLQERMRASGRELAYTTVATFVRILCDKDFLLQTTDVRPHRFRPRRSFKDVSGRLVKDLVQKVFGGSREALLLRLMEQRNPTDPERAALERFVRPKCDKDKGE